MERWHPRRVWMKGRACVRECWWERDDLDTRAGCRPLFMRAKRSCAQKRTGGRDGRQATGEAEAMADWVTSQWNGMFEVPEEVAVQPPRPGDSRVRSDRQTPGACRHSGGSHSSGGGRSTKGPPRKMGAGYPAKQLGALYLQGRELHPRYGLALGVVSQLLEDVTRPLNWNWNWNGGTGRLSP